MGADGKDFQENEHAAPSLERRSGIARRMSSGRRRSESAGAPLDTAAPDSLAPSSLKGLKSVRKFYFRSFEDRRGGTDRRTRSCDHESGSCRISPDADDVAGRPRPKG